MKDRVNTGQTQEPQMKQCEAVPRMKAPIQMQREHLGDTAFIQATKGLQESQNSSIASLPLPETVQMRIDNALVPPSGQKGVVQAMDNGKGGNQGLGYTSIAAGHSQEALAAAAANVTVSGHGSGGRGSSQNANTTKQQGEFVDEARKYKAKEVRAKRQDQDANAKERRMKTVDNSLSDEGKAHKMVETLIEKNDGNMSDAFNEYSEYLEKRYEDRYVEFIEFFPEL